jgi:dienelactone hydrolase
MSAKPLLTLFVALVLGAGAFAEETNAPSGSKSKAPNDTRLGQLKDLNGYFPFNPPKTKAEWDNRADYVRRRILVSQGLWPMPSKSPLNAVVHGKVERPDYTVEKVYFESAPGLFVTGNLYRPARVQGKVPAVLFAHGHWQDARLYDENRDVLRREIATGQERFEQGGRSRFQSLCVQLARMGCVVWQWDMLSDSDSVQFSSQLIHGFAKQRPEMNKAENWGLFSPQAETHLQSVMGLQTLNSIRSLDFVLSLPEVDPDRIAMTGASGGGTQTMILAAVDPRLSLSFPAVMVSTAMQGGCTCENASLLRIGTGNVEFAALFAPKPQGLTSADDWTKEFSEKGFPELKELYKLAGAPNEVMLARGEQFPHNYNAVSRSAFYTWLNRHFKLGSREPVIENDYELLSRDQLTVWDEKHPAPKASDADFERKLLKWLSDDAAQQLTALAQKPEEYKKVAGAAAEIVVGRTYETAGDVEWKSDDKQDRRDYLELRGHLRNKTHDEELPVVWLYPKKWNGRVVVWLADEGKSSLHGADGALEASVKELVDSGTAVIGADLIYQGDFLKDGKPLTKTRTVGRREAPAYTFGYNHAVFAQRAHDVLSIVRYLHTAKVEGHSSPSFVGVAAFGATGPIAAVARSVANDKIDAVAADTAGFRFGKLLDYRDPQFLPGGAKYLDLPGFIALGAPGRIWLTEDESATDIKAVEGLLSGKKPTYFNGSAADKAAAAAKWLSE